jgi:hypothetical protein
MSDLSMETINPSFGDAQDALHIPFTAHIRVVPSLGTGKRRQMLAELRKKARLVEADLLAAGFNIATPVAYTPQIGDSTARLTITGFLERSRAVNNRQATAPTEDVKIIGTGNDQGQRTAEITGNVGGSLSWGQDPTVQTDNEVKLLREAMDNASTEYTLKDIIHIEYNGVKYGVKKFGGRSFPQ